MFAIERAGAPVGPCPAIAICPPPASEGAVVGVGMTFIEVLPGA